jgi:hypothetical protein
MGLSATTAPLRSKATNRTESVDGRDGIAMANRWPSLTVVERPDLLSVTRTAARRPSTVPE